MDQKDQKKTANPLYLRPYSSASVQSHASSSQADTLRPQTRFTPRLGTPRDASSSQPAARRFTPKAPSSPTRRDQERKKEDDDDVQDAGHIFERMEASGKFDAPTTQSGAYGQRSYASTNRIRFNAAQNYAQSRMPAGAKKTGGNSKPLQNVSFGMDGKYRPITVPFYQNEAEGTGTTAAEHAEDDDTSKLFRDNGEWIEDQLILLQMPIILPEPVDPRDEAINANASGLHRIPDGKIGKLRTYKSGKVKLEIGGVTFDVSKGCDMKCHQEVCCVAPDQNVCMFMGPVPSRAVVTPDLNSVIGCDKRAAAP